MSKWRDESCHGFIITFTGYQFMLNRSIGGRKISSAFSPRAQCQHVCVALPSLQLNGKEALKVKDRLPAGLAIHHLHLMLQHMCKELS